MERIKTKQETNKMMIKQRLLILTFAIVAIASSFGQDTAQKIGYANVDYIMEKWPKIATAQEDIEIYEKQLQKQIDQLKQEYQMKMQQAQADQQNMTQEELQSVEIDLQAIIQKIKLKENSAMNQMQNKFNTIVQPLLDEILETIQTVGKEEGYTYILNQQSSATQTLIILYVGDEKNDISDKVLTKLGVTVTSED